MDKELVDKIKNSKDKIMRIIYDCFPEGWSLNAQKREGNDEN